MQYYYSLLESYQQLKKRKFKLTLREEEGADGIQAAVPEIQAAVQAAFGGDENYSEEGLGKGGNITIEREGADNSGNPRIKISGSNLGWGISLNQAKFANLNWKHKGGNGYKIASAWAGGEEDAEDEPEDTISGENRLLADKTTEEGIKAKDTIRELLLTGNAFPGLKDTGHTRKPETLGNTAVGDAQGFAGQVEDLDQRVLNSTLLDPQLKLDTLITLNDSLKVFKTLHEKGWSNPDNILTDEKEGMQEFEAKELGRVLSKMEVTPQGVLLGGVAIFYRGDSTPETDALRNLVEQLNTVAKVYNSQWGNATELINDPKIPELKKETSAPRTGGADESYRGPVAEKFMRCSAALLRAERDWSSAETSAEKKKVMGKMRKDLTERYQEATKDGSLDKMVEIFGIGRSVALGEIIANREHMNDAVFVETCQKVLEERGMAPDKAADMIKQAGGSPPERGIMMALLTTTMVNQTMDKELFGDDPELIPDNIIHEGDTDSASSGKKADLIFEWDDESKCKKIAAHYAKKLGNSPTESGCGGDNSGIKNLLTPKEGGGCRMEVELKTLSNSQSKKGAGELSPSRSSSMCDDAPVVADYDKQVLRGALQARSGMTQATKEFSIANNKRLDSCGGEGTAKRGCEQHKKIQTQVERYTKLLTPGSPGVTPERSQALLDNWWSMKQQNEKGKKRFEGATRAVNGSTNPEDKKALKKVIEDLQQQVFKREIHRTSKGAGEGTGKITDQGMKDYLLMNYSQACASTKETFRVTRSLADGKQGVYLNNATVEANMKKVRDGTARFEYKKGGTIINLVDEDGTVLAKNDTGRGISKWTIGDTISNPIKKSRSPKQESLLLTFLHGQQELIAELIGRTT